MKPEKHRKHYEIGELLAIYLMAKNAYNRVALMRLLKRSESAIDWVWSTIKNGRVIGEGQSNRIERQIENIRTLYPEPQFRGIIDKVPEEDPFEDIPLRYLNDEIKEKVLELRRVDGAEKVSEALASIRFNEIPGHNTW